MSLRRARLACVAVCQLIWALCCFFLCLWPLVRLAYGFVKGWRLLLRHRARCRRLAAALEADRLDRLRHPEKYRPG